MVCDNHSPGVSFLSRNDILSFLFPIWLNICGRENIVCFYAVTFVLNAEIDLAYHNAQC